MCKMLYLNAQKQKKLRRVYIIYFYALSMFHAEQRSIA